MYQHRKFKIGIYFAFSSIHFVHIHPQHVMAFVVVPTNIKDKIFPICSTFSKTNKNVFIALSMTQRTFYFNNRKYFVAPNKK